MIDTAHLSEVNLDGIADGLDEPWQPIEVAAANDAMLRMARLEGSFPWHHHDEDELFLCWRGSVRIEMRGHDAVTLRPGELVVVPKGTEHRPVAEEPAVVALVERIETKQYG